MKTLLGEYGIIVIACLSIAVVLVIYGALISGEDSGLSFIYNTDHIYDNDLLSSSDVVADQRVFAEIDGSTVVVDESHKPNFVVDTSATKDDYIISVPANVANGTESTVTSGYTYEQVLDMFRIGNKLKLSLWDGTKYVNHALPNDVELVITKYTPVVSGLNGEFILTEEDAVDKFGNYILNADGTRVQQTKVAYSKAIYTRDNIDEFYINWDEEARYSVIFRYTLGTLKAEYSTMFVNRMRPAESIYEEVYEWWSDWYEVDEDGNEVVTP